MAGSIQIFARALNVSEQELFAMMERGELLAGDVLPKVAQEFKRASEAGGAFAAASNSVAAEQNRLTNAWSDMVKRIKESTLWVAIAKIFGALAKTMNMLAPLVEFLADAIGAVLIAIVQITEPLRTVLLAVMSGISYLNQATGGWLGMAAGIGAAVIALSKFVGLMNILKAHPVMLAITGVLAGTDFLYGKFMSEDGKGFLSKASSYLTDQTNPYGGGDTYNVYGTDSRQIAEDVAAIRKGRA